MAEIFAAIKKAYNDIWAFVLKVLADAGIIADLSNVPEWVKPE